MAIPAFVTSVLLSSLQSVLGKFLEKHLSEIPDKLNLAMAKASFVDSFAEYIDRCYQSNRIINTIVFSNQQTLLKEIYVPLTLVETGSEPNREYLIDKYPKDLIEHYQRILIKDTAGMGKSTLVRYMLLSEIDGTDNYPIPFFIDLRRLTQENTLIKEIRSQLSSLKEEFNNDLMLSLFQDGGFIFYLDGYDEIALSERDAVKQDLRDFINKARGIDKEQVNYFVLTSREDKDLSDFGDFKLMNIRPLSKTEVFELLKRYDKSGERISEALINELNAGVYSSIESFLENPFLVSLLYCAYIPDRPLPQRKTIFYEQVFESFFGTRGGFVRPKKSGLGMSDFHKVLRTIGFVSVMNNETEFHRLDFVAILNRVKILMRDVSFEVDDLFYDLLHTVPLFCTDGVFYRWAHRSLQEYYAAEFIRLDSERKEEILTTIRKSVNLSVFYNLLDFYNEIDPSGFNRYIILPVLKEYVVFVDCTLKSVLPKNHGIVRRLCEMCFGRNLMLYIPTSDEQQSLREELQARSECYQTLDDALKTKKAVDNYRMKKKRGSLAIFSQLESFFPKRPFIHMHRYIKNYVYFVVAEDSNDIGIVKLIEKKIPDLISNNRLETSFKRGTLKPGQNYCLFCGPNHEFNHEKILELKCGINNNLDNYCRNLNSVLDQVVLLLQSDRHDIPGLDYSQSVKMIERITDAIQVDDDLLKSLLDQILGH